VVALLPDGRGTYADALVDVLERAAAAAGTFAPRAGGLATGLGRMTHLRRRLTMIVDRTPPKSLSPLAWILVVALCALLPLAPVGGQNRRAKPQAAGGAEGAEAAAPSASSPSAVPTTTTTAVDASTRDAVRSLLEMAQDPNDSVRAAGVNAIYRIGPRAAPVLIGALGGPEKSAAVAMNVLLGFGQAAADQLIDAVASPDAATRERALLALRRVVAPQMPAMGPEGDGGGVVVGSGTLVAGAEGGATPFGGRGVVGYAPGGFYPRMGAGSPFAPQSGPNGELAAQLIAPASTASTDPVPAVRRAAVNLLGTIAAVAADPAVAKPLVPALKDPDAQVRRSAAEALGWLVVPTKLDVSQPLAEAVKDSDPQVRAAALNALGTMGSRAAPAAATVVTAALKDPEPVVRVAAANALGALQPKQLSEEWRRELLRQVTNLWEETRPGTNPSVGADASLRILQIDAEPVEIWKAFEQVRATAGGGEHLDAWLKRLRAAPKPSMNGQIADLVEQGAKEAANK
jgi:HEAT repeat protein